ncbi:MAG: DUF2924 domain-containing protein [Ignavibacteriaceae bacterium]|nr:DUF2924 domain-containing protein [Ignavibacteriaceae bacterium]
MSKQRHLVIQHLENISGEVLEKYPDVIKLMIKGKAGVYALYRRQKLYYVGLASNLEGRLNTHLKDRHKGKWDRFSVYLTVHDEHMKELESLLLKISNPIGNKKGGGFTKSQNLRRIIYNKIKEKDDDKRALLIGGHFAERRRINKFKISKGSKVFSGIIDKRMKLKATYNGTEYYATLRKDGRIGYKGKQYSSLTAAAKAITSRAINGWNFWHFKDNKGHWTRIQALRK